MTESKSTTTRPMIALTSFIYCGQAIVEGGEYANDDVAVKAHPARFIGLDTTNAERRAARARLAAARPNPPTPEEVQAGALAHRQARPQRSTSAGRGRGAFSN
jgi:hypothetical protein